MWWKVPIQYFDIIYWSVSVHEPQHTSPEDVGFVNNVVSVMKAVLLRQ